MRITDKENFVFVKVLSKYLSKRSELHLFGSFVDDQATGGSIELLLVVNTDEQCAALEAQKKQIEQEIEGQIEDDEVKLWIVSEDKSLHDQTIRDLLPKAVFLYRW